MTQLTLPYKHDTIRAAAILTTGYVAATVIDNESWRTLDCNQLIIDLDFTIGSLTDCQIKVEFSNDGSAYYQESASSISGGVDTISALVHKLTATGKYRIPINIQDKYIKISAIGTGTVTNSSLAIEATVAYN